MYFKHLASSASCLGDKDFRRLSTLGSEGYPSAKTVLAIVHYNIKRKGRNRSNGDRCECRSVTCVRVNIAVNGAAEQILSRCSSDKAVDICTSGRSFFIRIGTLNTYLFSLVEKEVVDLSTVLSSLSLLCTAGKQSDTHPGCFT